MTISTKKTAAVSLAAAALLIGAGASGSAAELADRGIWYSSGTSQGSGVESADRGIWYSAPRTVESADRGIWY
ncbi:hypothetical protein [Desertihabitans aurantiacus]|uniref:hypothetical protein n=1 Tax=Desertihabitans aurantiacus TaxID=2282477 RepID=UPI000DF7E470|nr:hypothetical protein [Desertihabitans aurantiacus]